MDATLCAEGQGQHHVLQQVADGPPVSPPEAWPKRLRWLALRRLTGTVPTDAGGVAKVRRRLLRLPLIGGGPDPVLAAAQPRSGSSSSGARWTA